MAYYAALVSLKRTVERLLKSPKVSFLPPCQKSLEFAYEEVSSLRQVLDRSEEQLLKNSTREEVNALTEQIRDAACRLEDQLESHLSDQFFSQSESLGEGCPVILSLDTKEVKQQINYIKETTENLEKTIQELRNPLPEEDDVVSPTIHFGGDNSKMVGLYGGDIKFRLKQLYVADKDRVISIFGMAGIGKSKLAKEIYKDELDFKHFECCAWVTIGPEHQLKKVLLHDKLCKEGNEISVEDLYASLERRKYLFVVDDIWRKQDWNELRSSLPKNNNGSRVLLTTRLEKVARHAATAPFDSRPMPFLNEEESWDLLQQKVFGEECSCPFQLEKAGRKIAQKCEGIPLTIITIANILATSKKTPEYWNEVAEKKNSVFKDAYEQMSKVLFPSYKYLPLHLKAAFLYTGVFPPSSKIRASKLIRLWIAEAFLEPRHFQDLEEYAMKCLRNLVSSSVVCVKDNLLLEIKSWSLRSPFWYLCVREARKEKLFHVLETYPNNFSESVEGQQRFCILNNTLLGNKKVHDSMKSITTVRSLLCTGLEHHYPVPLFTGLKLLRVLDAFTIRFYNFPDQVLKLIHLRYLALTYSGHVPASISKLWNLQYLIVRPHMNINKSSREQSYIPIAIWDLQTLKHLEIMGSNLRDPCGVARLPNLLSLSNISLNSCTKEILKRFPKLMKLGVRIELAPDATEPMHCFDNLSVLNKLESLKCVIVNPNLSRSQIVAPLASVSTFPVFLRKLSLSGFGYPWECIRVIAKLRNLKVLKLRCYAFRGPKWVIHEEEFKKLEFLLLEDTDLVQWKTKNGKCFPWLGHIIIKHCYKLKELPSSMFFGACNLEVVDCPLVVGPAQELKKKNRYWTDLCIQSSWDEGKPML